MRNDADPCMYISFKPFTKDFTNVTRFYKFLQVFMSFKVFISPYIGTSESFYEFYEFQGLYEFYESFMSLSLYKLYKYG